MSEIVYHGSPNGDIEILKPRKSTHLKDYVYATDSYVVALLYAIKCHGDLDFDIRIVDNKLVLTERREGAYDKYRNPGYIYTLSSANFMHLEGLWGKEVVSEQEEKVLSCEYLPDISKKLEECEARGDITIYRYPKKPDYIPEDNSDLVDKYIGFEKKGIRGSIDRLLQVYPHLREQVFSKLETPEVFYYVSPGENDLSDITVFDSVIDAICNADRAIFIREDGWISYDIVDSKISFEKGGFNFDADAILYTLKGKSERLSAHAFHITDAQIVAEQKIDYNEYLINSKESGKSK